MFSINYQKNHARRLLGLTLTAAMLMSLFAVTSYSATRSRSFSVTETNGATTALTQPPTSTLKANGKIAFASNVGNNSEIFTVNPDGSGRTQLTSNPGDDFGPAFSPDGNRIAFYSNRDGNSGIYLMNADGSSPIFLTSRSSGEISWSPGGNKIAFSSDGICVMNSDGSNLTQVSNNSDDSTPAWSPDGTKIAFTRGDQNSFSNSAIYVMNVDGSNPKRLTNSDFDYGPAWSPDGAKLAFTHYSSCVALGNGETICFDARILIMNANDGSNETFLTGGSVFNDADAEFPTWSPDGTKIAFQGYRSGSSYTELFSINVTGGVRTNLSNTTEAHELDPDWGPVRLASPIDDPYFFVHQHYRDFLNREPDAPGLAHWSGEITACNDPSLRQPGESLALCVERKRASTSAAFFLSPEFQNTGSFVLRVYWGTLGKLASAKRPEYTQYIADMSRVASAIVVNDKLAPDVINANKRAFIDQFVNTPDFKAIYDSLSNQQFVDKLFATTAIVPTDAERGTLINALNSGTETRSSVVFKVVDGTQTVADGALVFNTRYGQAFYSQEFDSAFVFMEYVGYLQRNPDQAGYEYWLAKLKQYGNWVDAQMVLAFVLSPEYRLRFAQS